MAAAAPDRVTRCTTVSGIGPADADDLDFFAGVAATEATDRQVYNSPDADLDRVLADVREWIDGIKNSPEQPAELKARLIAAEVTHARAA